MPKTLRLTVATLCLLLCIGAARAEPVEVMVDAEAASKEQAVSKGLVEALQQVTGVAIAATQQSRVALAAMARADGSAAAQLTEASQAELMRQTNGIVRSYRILDVMELPGQLVVVHLSVVVEKFAPKGINNENRRRIAVTVFATGGAKTSPAAERLQDQISASLTQARRFAVVDRSQDSAYVREMALVQGETAGVAERARVGQVIGADYIVTGKLRQTAGMHSERVIGLTGEVVSTNTAGSSEVDFQVIEIATRQIKWANTVRFSGNNVNEIGAKIADEITQTIYPMRLISFDDITNMIINQGGTSLHPGQRYQAMVMGEMMFDPYTHEALGQVEQVSGIVEIQRVDTKLSYAKLVSGKLPPAGGAAVQIVLRPVAPAPSFARSASPRPVDAAVTREAPAITKLPFD